jgi:2-aminoadipate transaminase
MDYDRFLSSTGRQLAESAIRRMGTVVARSTTDLVSFAPGYPAPELFPWTALREISDALMNGTHPDALQYGPTRGYEPLLEAIVGLSAERGITAAANELLITSGSQQGIDLIARVMVSPGDVVLVELPTFTGGIAAFRNAQADLIGVRQDASGISIEALDDAWRRAKAAGKTVKLLYVIPNFQNPTGLLLDVARRPQLVEWAGRRDVLIVEDDPYGSLYFEDVASARETLPLRAQDPDGRVLYLSTFSKTLAPGFRVGWVQAPPALIERFETAKQSTDLTSGILDQRLVYEAVRQGVVRALAPRLRALYAQKRSVMEQAIRTHIGDRLAWASPRGGFFVWATLPSGYSDNALLDSALAHGVIFVSGSAFFVDGSGHDTIRLSFSAPSLDRIEEGIRRLAAAMNVQRPLGVR